TGADRAAPLPGLQLRHGGLHPRDGRAQLAALLPLLVAGPRGAGPLRGHPQDRPRYGRARGSDRRAAGGRRAVPGLHARPAAPRLQQQPRRADRGPLGKDDRGNALGGLVHGHGRCRRGRELLRPGGRRRALLRRLRGPRRARVLHARPLPQARGRRAHHRPPAGRALRALAGGGHRGARVLRARSADDHLAGRGVAPSGGRSRRVPRTRIDGSAGDRPPPGGRRLRPPAPAAPDDCETAALWLVDQAESVFGTARLLIEAYVGHVADRTNPDISPLYGDLLGLPPALLTVGTLDIVLEHSLAMAARLSAAGGDVEVRVYLSRPTA